MNINRRYFIKLHRQNSIHSGIIVCTEDADFEALAMRIHIEISKNIGLTANNLIRIYKPVM